MSLIRIFCCTDWDNNCKGARMVSKRCKEGERMNKKVFRLLIIEDDDARIAQCGKRLSN